MSEMDYWEITRKDWLEAMGNSKESPIAHDRGDAFSNSMRRLYPKLPMGIYPKNSTHWVIQPSADRKSGRWLTGLAQFLTECFSFLGAGAGHFLCVTTEDQNIDVFYAPIANVVAALPVLVLEPSLLIIGLDDASKLFIVDEYDEAHFCQV